VEGKVNPAIQTVRFGTTLKMECLSERSFYWLKNGKRLRNTNEYRNRILKLDYVALEDGGTYECHGSINSGEDKFFSSGMVIIQGKRPVLLLLLMQDDIKQ